MFEGTFRLLKLEAKLVLALLGLGFSLVTASVRMATWLVRRMSRQAPPAQAPGEPPSSTPPAAPVVTQVATPSAGTPVNVNVTVNNNMGKNCLI